MALSAPQPGAKRLIAFGAGDEHWLTQAQIAAMVGLPGTRRNWTDETDRVAGALIRSESSVRPAISPRTVAYGCVIPPTPTLNPQIPKDIAHRELVSGFCNSVDVKGAERTIEHLSTAYSTRYYTTNTGRAAVEWLLEQYREAAGNRPDVVIQLFEHSFGVQPSLIVTVPGQGATAGETVILGGHIDSTAGAAGSPAPGADDDASGSATVLEVFRTLMKNGFQPDYTVEFHAYAAEEVGLRGSQAVAQEYARLDRKVRSMVEMDMVGFPADTRTPVGLTTDNVDPELTAYVGKLIDAYSVLPHEASVCGYACSDHASWERVGVPSSFPFECRFGSHNPAIHSTNDVLSRMSVERVNEFVKIALGYVVELSLVPSLVTTA